MNPITRKRIMNLMEERNIKQLTLASDLGMTQASLSRNLNGVHEPKAETIEKIANYFNVSVDYLLGNTDDRKSNSNVENIDIAFFNQHGIVSDEQKREIESFIEYVKKKNDK